MADCIEKVLKAFPEADRKDIEALHKAMNESRRQAFMEGLSNPESQYAAKAKQILENYRENVTIQKIKTLENLKKRAQVTAFISDEAFKDKAEGLRSLIGGTFKKVEGGRMSVDFRQKGIRNSLLASLANDLESSPGLLDIFRNGDLDREIMIEVEQHALGPKGKPGISGSSEAREIGAAIHKLNQMELRTLNDSGAYIKELDGYIMRQSHDAESIKKAGYEKWRDAILPLLDHEKTFNRDFFKEDAAKFLQAVYEDVIDPKPKILQGEDADQVLKIIGTPSNMAKRLEQGRKLFFKDASSFYEYNKEFGKKTLAEQVVASTQATARSAGLMQVLGTNPKATFERLMAGLDKPAQKRLMNYMSEVDGTTSIPGHSPVAKYGAAIRMINDMSRLGGAVLSSTADIMTRAGTMRVQGENLLSAHLGAFQTMMENIPASQRAQVARLTTVGAESRLGALFETLYAQDGKAGMLAKAHQKFFDLSGIRYWSDINKAGSAQQAAAWLGEHAGHNFASLPEPLGRSLNAYGIGPVEWDILRGTTEAVDGIPMLGYGAVKELPVQQVKQLMERGGMTNVTMRSAERFQRDLSLKMATYFQDQVAIGMNEAGAREKAEVLRRGTMADTVDGQVMRFFAQFKSYPVTMISKFWDNYNQNVLRELNTTGKMGAVAPLLVSSMLLGYLANSTRNILKNKSPEDPFSKGAWMNAAMRGGLGGIYGDFLLGEFDSRHGRSALSAVAGPTFGQFDDVMDMWNTMKGDENSNGKSKSEKLAASGFRFLMNNAPGGNLFYLRGGLDYLFLNEIQETLNPGYMRRMKSRMKEDGQSYILGGGKL